MQTAIVLMLLLAAYNFSRFVNFIRYGEGYASRPPVAEGFLPIAAILAFKSWLVTGVIDPIHPAGLVIFVATIITAWIFRRALCSWICPIGTLSEQLAGLGRRLITRNLRVPGWLDAALLVVKYSLVIYLVRVFVSLPADETIGFMSLPFYAISDVAMFDMFANLNPIVWLIIGLIVLGSMLVKSFWCRYLCPYGALLGLVSILTPIFIRKDPEKCTRCGLCDKSCPAAVRIAGKKSSIVISPECIGCTSCVTICPAEGALEYRFLGFLKLKPLTFSLTFLVIFFGIIVLAKISGHWETSLTLDDYRYLSRMIQGQ